MELIQKLSQLGMNILTGDMIGADYCHDEYPGGDHRPDAVVEAASTEDVAALLRLCSEAGVPVTVRGAGTGQAGGSVPVNGGVLLSTRAMNAIVGLEGDVLRVQPGVLLKDVKAEAEKNGLCYPPDPGELTATIGGNVATNAGGPCAVKYGRTADYVCALTAVLADGSVQSFAGEALAELMGSEGTLAVITEISLKLSEKCGASAILLLPFAEYEAAFEAAKLLAEKELEPSVLEYVDTALAEFSCKVTGNAVFPIELSGERTAATLMLGLEGADEDEIMEKMELVACAAEESEMEPLDILVVDTPVLIRELWAAHSAFHTSMESGAASAWEVNVDIPMENAFEFISFAKEIAEKCGLRAYIHSHLASGGTHVHLASDKSREESRADAAAVADALYAKCAELGGDIVGEYGLGYAKLRFVSEEARAAQARLKAEYDPKGILNPGKRG